MRSDLFLATDVHTETPPLDLSGGIYLSSQKVVKSREIGDIHDSYRAGKSGTSAIRIALESGRDRERRSGTSNKIWDIENRRQEIGDIHGSSRAGERRRRR